MTIIRDKFNNSKAFNTHKTKTLNFENNNLNY